MKLTESPIIIDIVALFNTYSLTYSKVMYPGNLALKLDEHVIRKINASNSSIHNSVTS